jgi:hypothetical protein
MIEPVMTLEELEKRISELEKSVEENDAKIKTIVEWININTPKKNNWFQLDGEIMARKF